MMIRITVLAFFLILFVTSDCYANVFVNKLIAKSEVSSITEMGSFAINSNSQTYEKSFDIDNDSDLDIIRLQSNENSSNLFVELLLNDGNDIFIQSGQTFLEINIDSQVNIKLIDVYIQDLNNDGFKDVVFFMKSKLGTCETVNIIDNNFSIYNMRIYENKGNSQLNLAASFHYGENSPQFLEDDFIPKINFNQRNLDDFLDFSIENAVIVHKGLKLNFLNKQNFNFNLEKNNSLIDVFNIKSIDFNNDGNQDIISIANVPRLTICELADSKNIKDLFQNLIWLGDGNGDFFPTNSSVLNGRIIDIKSIDINSDGHKDLLISKDVSQNINTPEFKSIIYFGDETGAYNNSYVFDEFFALASIADMNNDGRLDLVTYNDIESYDFTGIDKQVTIFLNFGDDSFIKQENNVFYNLYNDVKLADMDNDGNMDVIGGIAIFPSTYPAIYYNHGDGTYSDAVLIGDGDFQEFVITDLNNDGLPDIGLGTGYFLKNSGERESNFATSINIDPLDFVYGTNSVNFFNIPHPQFKDLNNDGKIDYFGVSSERDEITGQQSDKLRVLLHDQTNKVKFHNVSDIKIAPLDESAVSSIFDLIETADFNNDGLLDIIISGKGRLRLLSQIKNPVIEDLYYDPTHSGHGYSIDNVGYNNLYYTLFFTYDDTGNSEWYLQLNRLLSTNNGFKLSSKRQLPDFFDESDNGNWISYIYNYGSQSTSLNKITQKSGVLENRFTMDENVLFDFKINDTKTNHTWVTEKLINDDIKPIEDFSGLWWAGNDDSGWGVSLNFIQRIDRIDVFAILYFYDAQGNTRWVVGQAENFIPSQPLTINMDMLNGYARDQNYVELEKFPAGSIEINLNEASQNINKSGIMSMNVSYPRGERMDWVRNDIPFTLFSKPKVR